MNFHAWDFVNAPNNYWNKEEGILAVKWLIEDKLKWNDKDIKENYPKQIYKDNNLYGMIQSCFNSSSFEAISSTYPNRFKEWELPNVPLNFWSSNENCINSTKCLIVEKLSFDITTAKQKLSYRHFKDNNILSLCDKHPIPRLIEMVEEGRSTKS